MLFLHNLVSICRKLRYVYYVVVDKLWWHVLVNESNYPLVGLGPKSSLLVGTYKIKFVGVLNFK